MAPLLELAPGTNVKDPIDMNELTPTFSPDDAPKPLPADVEAENEDPKNNGDEEEEGGEAN